MPSSNKSSTPVRLFVSPSNKNNKVNKSYLYPVKIKKEDSYNFDLKHYNINAEMIDKRAQRPPVYSKIPPRLNYTPNAKAGVGRDKSAKHFKV